MRAKSRVVLVVDDEVDFLTLAKSMLHNSSFEVITAHNGQVAIDTAQRRHVDVVLLDIMLPDISGLTVCAHLRADPRTAAMPVVMLTALGDYSTRRKAMQAGATDLLAKPVTKNELLAKLNGVMAEHLAGSLYAWTG